MEKKLNPGAQKALALKKNRSSKLKGTQVRAAPKMQAALDKMMLSSPGPEARRLELEEEVIKLSDRVKLHEKLNSDLVADLKFEKGFSSAYASLLEKAKDETKHWSDLHTQRSYQVGEERGKKMLYKRWVNIASIAFAVALIGNFIPRPDDCDPCQRVHQQENPLISTGITPPVDTRILATVKAYVDTSGVWRSADDGEPIEPLEWKRLSQ